MGDWVLTETCPDERDKTGNDKGAQIPGEDIDESQDSLKPLYTGREGEQQVV